MHVLLVSAGTYGNTLPFLGLGKALRGRGHDVTLLGAGYCGPIAQREGFRFLDLDDPQTVQERKAGETLGRGWRSFRTLRKRALRQMPRIYGFLADLPLPAETIVVAPSWLFGARIACEKRGLPLATLQLQPLLFRSIHETPRRAPRWLLRLRNKLLDRVMDRQLRPGIDTFRAEVGLPPLTQSVGQWWWSPQLVLGFFPEWYAPPQPDWPAATVLAGFPLYDAQPSGSADPEIQEFLHNGEPPLVFSQGSQVKDAQRYFAVSVEVARLLNRRAVLLTPQRHQVPQTLPAGIRHFEFVPLSDLLPHAVALVHHGGIGTIGQALAAGIPQLTVPGLLDQFDNSRRLLRLGVSANLRWRAYRPHKAARLLQGLLDSATVAEKCRDYAARCRARQPFADACVALERCFAPR